MNTPSKSSVSSVATHCKLKLYNSLTNEKEEFVPQNGNTVLWYSCGPTMDDVVHMGHARSYINFDVLRRVLSDYFGYDVFYVMNITDIDDKIIKRARQNHLFEEYKSQNRSFKQVTDDIKEASKHFQTLFDATAEKEKKDRFQKILDTCSETVKNTENGCFADALREFFSNGKTVLSEWLDYSKGDQVTDLSIFSKLPVRYEQDFFHDMESLNVLEPDVLTRVSEYVPEIVQSIQKTIEKGLAYESNASVYLHTVKMDDPSVAFGDLKQLPEGGDFINISSDGPKEKRNAGDVALWKASKLGEPSWESPWGKGRPGRHIEGSVVAGDVLGDTVDIRTGGYPNEAQAEDPRVRYFLRSGRLTIAGSEMSKSSSNVVTVRDVLDFFTARHIRLVFLLHSWQDALDFTHRIFNEALHYERVVREFLLNVKDFMLKLSFLSGEKKTFVKWTEDEKKLFKVFQMKEMGVHRALCDNIDTRSALENVRGLIRYTTIYIREKRKDTRFDVNLLAHIQSYILKTLNMFGLNFQ